MSRTLIAVAVAGAAMLTAGPAFARHATLVRANPSNARSIFTDSNKHYLDYKTDLSEARRELASDLRRAHDADDRIDAYAEYKSEVADARKDFRKEMAEKGIDVPDSMIPRRGIVTMDDGRMVYPSR
ncbi:hypothetical protein GCM10023219_14900 [Stakelama sediminis]|uniref:Acyl-coenzyme A synthetase/AMP-(Fatty) acid ligase n=1 Tax=Stakelama sediminis TaxID=463200 RepID=A0A840YXE2_9SPHN|nr:hypothetical protein [Stakelama sediminis]MBB5718219.1 acyl-coenzyme A synthetase/AMP-(fatty) acid ligase [Stakelama sediminis]